jgi:hypothetical protein
MHAVPLALDAHPPMYRGYRDEFIFINVSCKGRFLGYTNCAAIAFTRAPDDPEDEFTANHLGPLKRRGSLLGISAILNKSISSVIEEETF